MTSSSRIVAGMVSGTSDNLRPTSSPLILLEPLERRHVPMLAIDWAEREAAAAFGEAVPDVRLFACAFERRHFAIGSVEWIIHPRASGDAKNGGGE